MTDQVSHPYKNSKLGDRSSVPNGDRFNLLRIYLCARFWLVVGLGSFKICLVANETHHTTPQKISGLLLPFRHAQRSCEYILWSSLLTQFSPVSSYPFPLSPQIPFSAFHVSQILWPTKFHTHQAPLSPKYPSQHSMFPPSTVTDQVSHPYKNSKLGDRGSVPNGDRFNLLRIYLCARFWLVVGLGSFKICLVAIETHYNPPPPKKKISGLLLPFRHAQRSTWSGRWLSVQQQSALAGPVIQNVRVKDASRSAWIFFIGVKTMPHTTTTPEVDRQCWRHWAERRG